MSDRLNLSVERLKATIGAQNPQQANNLLAEITQFFEDELTDVEQDLAIEKLFGEYVSILAFVEASLPFTKTFKGVNVQIFVLFKRLIERYKGKVTDYAGDIVKVCVQYILTEKTSAAEKEKATLVIHEIVAGKLCKVINKAALLNSLFRIFDAKKQLGTLLHRAYELIGLLSREYPDCITDDTGPTRIKDMYFQTLEKTLLNQEYITYPALTGALVGFRYFLTNFAPVREFLPSFSQRLYTCIKKLSDPPSETTQRAPFRAALQLLSEHSEIFGEHLFADCYYWHKLLTETWLNKPWEDRKTAIYLLHAFHKEIARQCTQRKDRNDIKILTFFINYFKVTLQSANSHSYEIRIAIRGFGVMAEPCKEIMDRQHIDELLTLIMQRTENASNEIDKTVDKEKLEHFPDLVQALSEIMNHVDELSGIQICTLQNIMVALMRDFHYLSQVHHALVVQSLMKTFHNLSRLGDTVLDDVLHKVIYQGVIWTCSHNLVYDAKGDWDTITDWKDHLTYKFYLPLWTGLLTDVAHCDFDRPAMVRKIYEHFMKTLFRLLEKLNLTTRKRVYRDELGNDLELYFCDKNYDLEPIKVKDFHIFFNVVDLYRDILLKQSQKSHTDNFAQWINQFFTTMITRSFRYPLVSGYYKLMQLGLQIADTINYFTEVMDVEGDPTWTNVSEFYKNAIAMGQQAAGELQLSCIRFLFSAPIILLKSYILELIPIFVIALELGKSKMVMHIAHSALTAMEKYIEISGPSPIELREFLKAVLPLLDPYLQGLSAEMSSMATVQLIRERGKRQLKRSLIVTESDLMKLQKRIILFLGKLEPEHCLLLVASDQASNLNLAQWDVTRYFELKLGGCGIEPTIYLDTLMPHICDIALTATERQKKVAACEIVHSVVLYLIGSGNHLGALWSELFKRILYLGCDGDFAVQQMFEPLIMQIMHYMSQRAEMFRDGAAILVNCLMEAISNPTQSAVRDLSARCLREFLLWAIKQSTPEEMALSTFPANIRKLIEIIKLYSFDSSQHKRHGAALAFNNLYRVLREEEAIIDKYCLDLLHTFCFNFVTTEEFGAQKSIPVDLEQVSASLDHVVRVLTERRVIFNRPNNNRVRPTVFADGCQLQDAVLWLFQQCGTKHTKYRKKVIELFNKLVTCIDGCSSAAAFVQSHHPCEAIIKLCEGPPDGYGIAARPDLSHVKGSKSPITLIYNWLEHLLASLDCYTWLIGHDLIQDVENLLSDSAIFKVLRYFLDHVMLASIMNLLCHIDPDLPIECDIGKREKIPLIKCAILAKLFEFLNKLLPTHQQFIPPSFWLNNQRLIDIISQTVFDPISLGFDLKNQDEHRHFPEHIELLIIRMGNYAPVDFVRHFQDELSRITSTKYKDISDESQQILRLQNVASKQFIVARGIETVFRLSKDFKHSEHLQQFLNISAAKTLYELFAGVREESPAGPYALNGAPDMVQFSNHVLRISLDKESIYTELIDLILNTTELRVSPMANAQKTRQGKQFLNLHKNSIFDYFVTLSEVIIGRLVCRITAPNILYILKILIDFTEYVYRNKQHDKPKLQEIAHTLLNNWPLIYLKSQQVQGAAITLALIELMTNIAMIYPKDLTEISTKAEGFQEWCLNIIEKKESRLEIKSQAILLLPCIVNQGHSEHAEVTKALNCLQSLHFPLHSTEFRDGSIERSSFMNVLQSLLDALCVSRSSVILKFLINCTAADDKHILEYTIQQAIEKYMKLQKPEQQVKSLHLPFELWCDTTIEPSNRASVMQRFLIGMLRNCSMDAVLAFYTANIKKIHTLSEQPYGFGVSQWDLEHAFASRRGAYELIEMLFGAVPREQFKPVTVAYLGADKVKDGSEIISTLSKKAYGVRSEVFVTSNAAHREQFRKYQCSAYRALCVIVSNTQKELRLYQRLLFVDKPNQHIWKNIINTSDIDLYTDLTVEIDKNPKIKDRFVSIRRLQEGSAATNKKLPRYIESQNVFDSSLSQDVTKIDLSLSAIRTDEDVATLQIITGPSTIPLEKNSINDHEVMASICAVIQHMFEVEVTPVDGIRQGAPAWVEAICQVLESDVQHRNIRLFLAMVVDNCRQQFRQYAPRLTVAILKVLVSDCFRQKIDAFVIYLTVTLLEWNEVYKITTPDEFDLASELVENLMKYAWNDRKIVFTKNLDVIKNLMEIWRDVIKLPRNFLFESLCCTTSNESKANLCGIQLNGIVLANHLIPWSETTQNVYLDKLAKCIDSNLPSAYKPASQVLGMAIAKIEPFEPAQLNNKLENIRKKDEKKFSEVLYGIHKYYAPVVDYFFTQIASLIPSSAGAIKRIYLEMFLTRIHIFENLQFREVLTIRIRDLLKNKEHQLLALHIVSKVLPTLAKDEIEVILFDICAFAKSKSSECRDIMYEILIYIHKNFKNGLDASTTPILLNGLLEPDAQIQGTIFNFWTSEAQLPPKLDERIEILFKQLYNPEVEGRFLNYCVQLLLQPSIEDKLSQMFLLTRKNVGPKPKEYEINISWKTQNSVLTTPLFMESQQRKILAGETFGGNFLRATVADDDLNFQPTLQPDKIYQRHDNFPLNTNSSLLFSGQTQILDRRSQRIDVPRPPANDAPSAPLTKQQKQFQSLRARILRDPDQLSRKMALGAVERRGYDAIRTTNTQKRNENQVTLYRRYRIGDFPDFEITGLSLLMPLQALAKYDQTLARKLMVAIFEGIVGAMGVEKRPFILTMNDCIKTIFMRTKNCDSVLFTTLIEIALQHPQLFNIQPDVLATIANANSTMAMGILFMESRLSWNYSIDRNTHGSTASSIDNESLHWIKLADLYYNLSEYDIVTDIFADKLRTDQTLTEAIEMKAHGDFPRAISLYTEIIEKCSEATQQPPEVDFAYQSIYNCYANMGKWAELLKQVEDQLKDDDDQQINAEFYEQLWNDDWNMEHLLPHYIQSELRTTLNQEAASESFVQNMAAWMRNNDRSAYIKHNFSEELMMLQMADLNFREARVSSEQHFMRFLSEWSNLNVLSDKVRANKILNIRNVAEIHKYADWLIADDSDSQVLTKLTNRWQNIQIQTSDSISMWDSLIAYRKYIHQVALRTYDIDEADSHRRQALVESVFDMQFALIDAALQQNNLPFSNSLIEQMEEHLIANVHDSISAQWHLSSCKYLAQKSQSINIAEAESLNSLFVVWDKINETIRTHSTPLGTFPELYGKALTQTADIAAKACELLLRLDVVSAEIERTIIRQTSLSTNTVAEERLYEHSIKSLEKAIELAENSENSENEDGMQVAPFRKKSFIGETYHKLAMFCMDHLDDGPTVEQQSDIITYILRGMRHDSRGAHLQFPRILLLPNVNDYALTEKFDEEVANVPDWMFLKWIPQILSSLDFSDDCFLDKLVLRLSMAYPSAMIYPFQLSLSQYKRKFPRSVERELISRCVSLLRNPLAEILIRGMQCLCIPRKLLETHLANLNKMILYEHPTDRMFHDAIDHVLETVFRNDSQGPVFETIARFQAPLEELLVAELSDDWSIEQTAINNLVEELNGIRAPKGLTLKSFCPTLDQFQLFGTENDLELPGQYNGETNPNINQHIKIFRFNENITIFDSTRQPIKITIYGSDAKQYDYVVKYGEDLRQDERIQQLLDLMARQLFADKNCRNHKMSLQTYQVIPFNVYCGMLSFVNDTVSISELIVRSYNRRDPVDPDGQGNQGILIKLRRDYEKFIGAPSKDLPEADQAKTGILYGNAASFYSRDELIKNFLSIEDKIPTDLIKSALLDISNSPESFFVLRNNFATSVATMNITNWVLGIGDRHLNNILINAKTGKVVGIDFGVAFGAGIRNLGIPEMMPFRLTAQFTGAVAPLETTGIIKKTMVHGLRVFRAERKLLLACMEVFVREPTIDWLQSAHRLADDYEDTITSDDSDWEPNMRLETVRHKLIGQNPMRSFLNELENSKTARIPKFVDGYGRIVKGDPTSVRRKLPGASLSVEEQITCLIEMAQDKAMLGISYVGLQPWL